MASRQQIEPLSSTVISQELLAMWEVLSVITSCLITEWVVLSFVGRSKAVAAIPVVLAVTLMVLSARERRETLAEIGFGLNELVDAARLLFFPTIAAVVLILISSWWIGDSDFSVRSFRARFLLVPLWALFQQYAMQGFINRRIQILLGKGLKSVLVVALLFSILHLPNPLLTCLTFFGGLIWAAVYQRHPNLFALALSHSVASIVLALTFPQHVISSLRVGFKYFGLTI